MLRSDTQNSAKKATFTA